MRHVLSLSYSVIKGKEREQDSAPFSYILLWQYNLVAVSRSSLTDNGSNPTKFMIFWSPENEDLKNPVVEFEV